MVLTQEDIEKVARFVKVRPRTVQEVAQHIGRSWVTADSYIRQINETTGLVNIITFRKGSQGALKIVYYNFGETPMSEEVKAELFAQIKNGRTKDDFDFFEVFQSIEEKKRKVFTRRYQDETEREAPKDMIALLKQTERTLSIFSGNLSFITLKDGKTTVIDVLETLLKRKVRIKILCKVNIASLNNLSLIEHLLKKYPEFLEIKHCYQPLRGLVIDDSTAQFKSMENLKDYKEGELEKNIDIFYEIYDKEWAAWLQEVFWKLWRVSSRYSDRAKQLKALF